MLSFKIREAVCKRREGQCESLKAGVIYPISVEELVRTENKIVKHVQGTSFREELISLGDQSINDTTNKLKVKYVKKSSPIYNLDPQLIDGILRVGGRLKTAPIPRESKHPIIVPKNNHISNLIVRYYHQNLRSRGTQTCFVTPKGTFLDSWSKNHGETNPQ